MNEQIAAPRSIVVERLMPHPPENIWRALTLAHLIEQCRLRTALRDGAIGRTSQTESMNDKTRDQNSSWRS